MVMHGQDSNCGSGPDELPNNYNGNRPSCTKGAFILKGFTDITVDDNLADLILKIGSVPAASVKRPNYWGKGEANPFQASALYFEFFRYLTGQAVYNGFLGFGDYGSGDIGNLYHDLTTNPTNDILINLYDGEGLQPLLSPDISITDVTAIQLGNNSVKSAKYNSPLDSNDECSGTYMINTFFGVDAGGDRDLTTAVGRSFSSAGLDLNLNGVGELPGSDRRPNTRVKESGAIINTLYGSDLGSTDFPGMTNIPGKQNVVSYWLAEKDAQNAANYFAFAGGTGQAYPLTNPQQALDTILGIIEEILSVSTTFVAASVPTNVFNRARAVDNIYFALFQAEKEPWWSGNIKKLRIARLESSDPSVPVELVIAQAPLTNPPARAISNIDGRIKTDALTFWTNPNGYDVQAFDPNENEVAGKDGRSITRGGAGQKIPGYLSGSIGDDNSGVRKMFTEDPSNLGTGIPLAVSDQALLSPYLDPNEVPEIDVAVEQNIIRWIRGMDAFNGDSSKVTNPRPWLMSDPMHSRPLVVNYGAREGTTYTDANPDIRLFFGTNDGVIHFVQNTDTAANETGAETVAFIPLEMLSMQYTLSQNAAQSTPPHIYGMDGEAVSYVYDEDRDGNIENNDFVWVFIGQRRGGTGIYAFDLTNPDNPTFKWKITNQTPGFDQLALTFSTPQAVTLDLGDALGTDDGESDTPVLIFAGGYNGGWDGNSRVGKDAGNGDDTVGNAIYVVNADTGDLIWKAVGPDGVGTCTDSVTNFCVDGTSDTDREDEAFDRPSLVDSIPSEMAVVDSDNNNIIDRAYVGDSGGNVWRVELTEHKYMNTVKSSVDVRDKYNWYVTKLGQLGGAAPVDERRFFHAPDYVKAKETDTKNKYDGVIITSGDRANPRETTVQNYAFMIKDPITFTNDSTVIKKRPPYVAQDPSVTYPTGLTDITDICIDGNESETACKVLDLANGWKLKLEEAGEKGLSRPLTTSGVVLFTTYVPNDATSGDICAPSEGIGRVYLVNLGDGSAAFDLAAQINVWTKADRFSEVGPGIPGDVIPYEDLVLIPGKGIGGKQLYTIPGRNLWRVYWREDEVDQ
ncbi:MAG: hypothetical protein DRQ65_06090 [Gammaproteobacteria bacterium]|nr:MAG: hypothetical protein DRQ65_06090 [Gammaproteobacteria bacterium]